MYISILNKILQPKPLNLFFFKPLIYTDVIVVLVVVDGGNRNAGGSSRDAGGEGSLAGGAGGSGGGVI